MSHRRAPNTYHSPTGFAWGYRGSGPTQLALAILLRMTGNTDFSLLTYHTFKVAFLVGHPQYEDLEIPRAEVSYF